MRSASNKLTIKQEKYAQGLFKGLTQREAYKQAYDCENMTDKSIDEVACVLAADLKVSSRIEQLRDELALRNMVTVERILTEYAKLGYYDPRNLFDENGRPKEISELDDATAAALAGLDVQEIYEGEGENRHFVGYSKKYKLNDKKGALDSMSRYLGMFNDKVELTGKGGGPIQTAVNLSTLSEADLALMEALLKKAAGEGSE